MILRERISAAEKYEVLSTLSPNLILLISGFLGGLIVALLLSPLVILLIQGVDGVVWFLAILSFLGAIAAKLLQWEYKINREAYKRVAEFHIPLVYPFFFLLCLLGGGVALWPGTVSKVPNITVWVGMPILVLGAAILGSALGAIWRFCHILWLSFLSPIDWGAVVEARIFNRQLNMSFAEVKRYPSPLSLTIMGIDQSDQLKGREMRRVQKELVNIIDNNIRETDAVGRIEGGRVVITLTHTGSSGAAVQAERVRSVLKKHLKSLEGEGKRITLSVGIASYAPDMASHRDLIEKAQVALLRAKDEGGDRLSIG